MQEEKKKTRRSWVLIGFGIGAVVAFLINFGIAGLLFLIGQFQLSEDELVIFTSLFYGIVFFFALGGMRFESRKYKMLVTGRPFQAPPPPVSKIRETMGRIRSVLWYIFGLFSLGWLTPALIIYWTDLKHPDWAVSIFAYLFSFAAGTAYVIKRADSEKTGYDYAMLYIGICMGALLVDRIIGVLCP